MTNSALAMIELEPHAITPAHDQRRNARVKADIKNKTEFCLSKEWVISGPTLRNIIDSDQTIGHELIKILSLLGWNEKLSIGGSSRL